MNKKILIIDDEELIIRSLSKLLEKNSYETFVAKTGQDALIMVEEESFDLIISDVRMPGFDGVETVKGIYENLVKNNIDKPPVIFITGYADEACEEGARALEPVDYIYKPFNISDLVDRVKEVLS